MRILNTVNCLRVFGWQSVKSVVLTDAYIALFQGGEKQLDIHCLYVCDHS